jgi:predicted N-acetyltransferase YhbS
MQIIIRTAEEHDAAPITDLSGELGYENKKEDIQNRLKLLLSDDDHCVFVALYNDKIVGWIHGFFTVRIESDFFVEIGGLVVKNNVRGNGIGKKLVDKVIEWAEFKKCRIIRVRSNVIRKESHRFYENIGFKINKEQKIFDKRLA